MRCYLYLENRTLLAENLSVVVGKHETRKQTENINFIVQMSRSTCSTPKDKIH